MSDEDGVGLWAERWSMTYTEPSPFGMVVEHGLGLERHKYVVNIGDDNGLPIPALAEHLGPDHLYVRVGYYLSGHSQTEWVVPYHEAIIVSIIRSA